MLRTLVLALILGNLVLWAWSHAVFGPLGWAPARVDEPQRLRQQVHPDALVLLDPQGRPLASSASLASAAAAASTPSAGTGSAPGAAGSAPAAPRASGPASAPAQAASASASASASTSTSAAATGTVDAAATCLRIGPYAGAPDAALGSALHAAGLDAQAREQDLPAQWMVMMGPYADTSALHRKLGELRQLSLPPDSFVAVSARPRYMPGISLGVFDKREQAQAQLQHVQAHGVQTAHIVQRNLGMRAQYWVLPALSQAQVRQLRALPALRAANLRAQDCPASP